MKEAAAMAKSIVEGSILEAVDSERQQCHAVYRSKHLARRRGRDVRNTR